MNFKKVYTEDELIAGCMVNDRKAQEYLYRQFFQPIWGMCMRYIKNEADAMDILNEGFLKVFLKIDKYESKGNLEGWIRRVVYNTLVDHVRKNQKYTRFMVFEDFDAPYKDHGHGRLYEEDLMREIDQLPKTAKEVFKLYAIEGYNHNEIAELLDMSEGTSRWYLSEARKKLKDRINHLELSLNAK